MGVTPTSAVKAPLLNGLINKLFDVTPSGKIITGVRVVLPYSISFYRLTMVSMNFYLSSLVPFRGTQFPSEAVTKSLTNGMPLIKAPA